MNSVAFLHRGEVPKIHDAGYMADLESVFGKLAARNIEPIVIAHAESAFSQTSVQASHPDLCGYYGTPIHEVPLSRIGAMVNIVHRSIKKDLLPHPEQLPPLINENETRSLGWDKQRMYQEVLKPLRLGMPSVLAESAADIEAFATQQAASEIILKPNTGAGVVTRANRAVAHEALTSEQLAEKPQIVQAAYNFTRPFPGTFRPYDLAVHDKFNALALSDHVKELRVYGFLSPQGVDVLPAGRVIDGKRDDWFFVDPDAVPHELYDQTTAVMHKVAQVSGALAVYGSVDFGYGGIDKDDPDWHVIEVNARSPHMIRYNNHQDVAGKLRDMFATQLAATAAYRSNSV